MAERDSKSSGIASRCQLPESAENRGSDIVVRHIFKVSIQTSELK